MQKDTLHLLAGLRASALNDGPSAPDTLFFSGDDSGGTQTLVYLDVERVGCFTSWSRLASVLEPLGLLKIDPAGCQFVLAYGVVPPPYSLYANVYALSVGDRLEVDLERNDGRHSVEFPYTEQRSRGDQQPGTARLKRLLGGAVARAIPSGIPGLFLQSAGKDSTALLIGLAESGRTDVEAVTYHPAYREEEAPVARELAGRYGIAHRTVAADAEREYEVLLRFAERSPSVCADVALVPYLYLLDACDTSGGVIVDGLGSDAPLGYVQSLRGSLLAALAAAQYSPSLWGRFEPPDLGAPGSYLLKSLLMYPAERYLPGSRLAPRTVRELIPHDTAFSTYFARLDRERRRTLPVDGFARIICRIYEGGGTFAKGHLAAGIHGACMVYPFCDAELIDYCFHLPRSARYDPRRRTNKVLLRRLLEEEIGASHYLQHKGSFRFDVLRFVAHNERAIRAELAAATHLFSGLDRWAEFFLRRKSNYVHAYALLTLFMLAGWLARRPAEVVKPLTDPTAQPAAGNVVVSV